MARHNDIGKWGEQMAVDRLTTEGWAIRERNWRMGHLEVDIIAQKDGTLVFAEVKTRSELGIDPLEAVDRRKMAHMATSAAAYMAQKGLDIWNVRFDIFAVCGTPEDGYTLEHVADAFDPPRKYYG